MQPTRGSSGGSTSADPSKGPAGVARGAGLFSYRSAQAAGGRGGCCGPRTGLGSPDPLPWPPSPAALLTAREPEEFLCFTERLEDLVCFWEEAASAGVGPDNYSFSYQLE